MIEGDYIGENKWESECKRFRAVRLIPSYRKWIVIERVAGDIKRWSRPFNDLEAARIDMTARLAEIDEGIE